MDKVLIGGGSGLVGKRLTELLQEKGYEVSHLSRRKSDGPTKTIAWNIEKMTLDQSEIEPFDYIINLAGAGIVDKPWTAKRKQEIVNSRVNTTLMLVDAMSKNERKPKAFVSASAIGYYGFFTSDRIFTEEDEPGKDFLADTCVQWETNIKKAQAVGVPTSMIRIGLVLSKNGGALKELANPVKFGLGAALGSGKQYMPWIHIDDLCHLFIHAMEQQLTGPFNATVSANKQVSNKVFMKVLSSVFGKPFWLPNVPAFVLSIILGSRKLLVLEGSRISSEKIQKSGFRFRFEELKDTLKEIYS